MRNADLFQEPTQRSRDQRRASSHKAYPREPQLVFVWNAQTQAPEQVSFDWGLIPNFATSWPSIRPINARAESIRDTRIFAESYRLRRCIVPMASYFQKDRIGKRRVIARADGQLFGVAGIWDTWTDPDARQTLRTFATITVPANSLISPIHDRMPAILERENFRRWLDGNSDPHDLLKPFPSEAMSIDGNGSSVDPMRGAR